MKIVEPEKRFIDAVLGKAGETGDFRELSAGDVSIIALCLQIGGELVTDDFAVSNVAKHLNLKVLPLMTGGAKKMEWVYFCSGCGRTVSKESTCPVCGSTLRRRAKAGRAQG